MVTVVVMSGAGLVRSSVGVGGSRVGIGACVGVDCKVPRGKFISVGDPRVGGAARTVRATRVGVACRSVKPGRTKKLILPTQYNTAIEMTPMTKQP